MEIKQINKNSWHQQPEESDGDYALFVRFRVLGSERSISKLKEKLKLDNINHGLKQLSEKCKKWKWIERAQAYDLNQAIKIEEDFLEAKKRMSIRELKMAEALQDSMHEGLIENIQKHGKFKGSTIWGVAQSAKSHNIDTFGKMHKRLFGEKQQVEIKQVEEFMTADEMLEFGSKEFNPNDYT